MLDRLSRRRGAGGATELLRLDKAVFRGTGIEAEHDEQDSDWVVWKP